MRCVVFAIFAVLPLLVTVSRAQEKYRFCAPDTISEDACYALQRGESQVLCLRVTDSAECAIRLSRGEADFGVFTAEELLLAYQFYAPDVLPIYQLRHQDKADEEFEFQAVAVVTSDYGPVEAGKGFLNLKNGGLCHPGFSKAQWWNDYILKYFERSIYKKECSEDLTAAENEARNLKAFFGKACRPGDWVSEQSFNDYLKKQYPELCALCDDPASCTYSSKDNHGHTGALACLTAGRGKVAYAALSHVRQYLAKNDSYQFLCPDGSVQPLSTENPCAWIKQPWTVIASRRERAVELTKNLTSWLQASFSESWTIALRKILVQDTRPMQLTESPSLASYLGKGREVDLSKGESCGNSIRWCTIGEEETNKCKWVAKETLALGIEPRIECHKTNSTFQCFRDIAQDRADVITIDSNYGHLARQVYGLSTLLYSETDQDRYSVVVAVVREPESSDNDTLISFHQLKGRRACFPEYGGIAWLSFVNTVRTNGIISSKPCNYPKLVADLLGGACTPGVHDDDHSNETVHRSLIKDEVTAKLCNGCLSKLDDTSCEADPKNRYYGDKGALNCLSDRAGDIAFIEARNLIDGTIDENKYRVLCKNNSLAVKPGFVFDDICALSVTIDSEIVSRKNNSKVDMLDMTLALLKIEDWLGYRVYSRRPIHIYDRFNGTKDLLFKDSTSGMVTITSQIKSVLAYKELFSHVETCSSGVMCALGNPSLITLVLLCAAYFARNF